MSIMWKYLDKRSATIAAIKDYDAMQFIINSTDDHDCSNQGLRRHAVHYQQHR